MTPIAIALAASAALCASMTTSVEVRRPETIIVAEERWQVPPGADACSEGHYTELREAWARLERVEADLRELFAFDRTSWRVPEVRDDDMDQAVHRQLDAVARYKDEIRSLFRACEAPLEPEPIDHKAGCG